MIKERWCCETDDNDARDMITTAHDYCKQLLQAADAAADPTISGTRQDQKAETQAAAHDPG